MIGRRDKLRKAQNYALYYGVGKARDLERYDMAIVEPLGQSLEDVQRMQRSNTLVIGYVSVMEIHPSHPEFARLKTEDFLTFNGQPCKNDLFGTYLVDLRSKRWLGILNHQIGSLLLHTGYDGIFLDTIGDVEMFSIPQGMQMQQMEAAVKWLEQLRHNFPEYILIQNNGLEALCKLTAPWIDAICWENPPFGVRSAEEWMQEIISRLSQLQDEYRLRALLLFEQTTSDMRSIQLLAQKAAEKHNFLIYTAPAQYVSDVF